MTATNHTLTGVVIGLSVTNPFLALPIAFASHFLLDALPHFGDRKNPDAAMGRLKYVLPIDILLALIILIIVFMTKPAHWQLGIASGVLAASPDLWSIPVFLNYLKTGKFKARPDWFFYFHSKLQWGERLWGSLIELVWFTVFGYILLNQL